MSNTYSIVHKLKYISDVTIIYKLYKQFVAWNCNGCLIAQLTDYVNNTIYQELKVNTESEYYTNVDKRVYIDLRDGKGYTGELQRLRGNNSEPILKINLKPVLTKKMKLRLWGYSQGEYLYLITKYRLTIKHAVLGSRKTLRVNFQQDPWNALL